MGVEEASRRGSFRFFFFSLFDNKRKPTPVKITWRKEACSSSALVSPKNPRQKKEKKEKNGAAGKYTNKFS